MKTFRVFLAGLVFAAAWITPCWSQEQERGLRSAREAESSLTGELVVIKGTADRFRLVGHGGTFTAPSGVSIAELDGKPVRVELAANRRVLDIDEIPIEIQPIVHGFEIISGELVAIDPAARTFSIAGMDRVFVAPPGFDVRHYAGRRVNLRLDERGQLLTVRQAELTAADAPMSDACPHDGRYFLSGTLICRGDTQYHCERGSWRNLGTGCTGPRRAYDAPPSSCTYENAVVEEGASICVDRSTLRCSGGWWINTGLECPR